MKLNIISRVSALGFLQTFYPNLLKQSDRQKLKEFREEFEARKSNKFVLDIEGQVGGEVFPSLTVNTSQD